MPNTLFIKAPDGTPNAFGLEGRCTIGRHPDNSVVLNDGSVSVNHAEIFTHDGAVLLKDLISSNGTYVNGSRVIIKQLKDGDQIRFGNVEAAVSIETVPVPKTHLTPPPLLSDPSQGHG